MCLGIPGRVLDVAPGPLLMGRVAFGSVVKEVCLAYVPEVRVGEYVVVHAGFAIACLDERAASRTLAYLEDAGRLLAAEEEER